MSEIAGNQTPENTDLSARARISVLEALDQVIVNTVNDFPAAVGGYITLEAKDYKINADISTTLKFKAPLGGAYCRISSIGLQTVLEYTGTDALFEDSAMAGSLVLDHLVVSAPSGAVFDLVGPSGNEVIIETCTFFDIDSIGTIKDCDTSTSLLLILSWNQGLIIDGGYLFMISSTITAGNNQAGAVMLTTQGALDSFIIDTAGFVTAGANETIFDLGGTIDEGVVSACRFKTGAGGTVFAPGSLDYKDLDFTGNTGADIINSSIAVSARLTGNATVTDIPAVNAFVIPTASTWAECPGVEIERGTLSTDGVWEYTGNSAAKVILAGNIAPDPSTATKDLAARFINIHAHATQAVTFTNATNTINEVGTSLVNGDLISFYETAGTLPTGLRKDIVYYVINKAVDSFQISYTSGGAAVAFTTDGVGTNVYSLCTCIGSVPRNAIASGTPRDLPPNGFTDVINGDKVAFVLQNLTDAVNLNCGEAYFRISG